MYTFQLYFMEDTIIFFIPSDQFRRPSRRHGAQKRLLYDAFVIVFLLEEWFNCEVVISTRSIDKIVQVHRRDFTILSNNARWTYFQLTLPLLFVKFKKKRTRLEKEFEDLPLSLSNEISSRSSSPIYLTLPYRSLKIKRKICPPSTRDSLSSLVSTSSAYRGWNERKKNRGGEGASVEVNLNRVLVGNITNDTE